MSSSKLSENCREVLCRKVSLVTETFDGADNAKKIYKYTKSVEYKNCFHPTSAPDVNIEVRSEKESTHDPKIIERFCKPKEANKFPTQPNTMLTIAVNQCPQKNG